MAASGVDKYISLCDAFVALGKAKFQDKWDGQCLCIGPGSYEAPHLYDPAKIEPENWADIERAEGMGIVSEANKNQLKCYYDTLSTLKKNLVHDKFKAVAIKKDGTHKNIPGNVWRDTTGNYTINIFDSIIYYTHDNRQGNWEVEIETDGLDKIIKPLNRSAAVKKNTVNIGRPPYDRDILGRAIKKILKNLPEGFKNRQLCLGVEQEYKKIGFNAFETPSSSVIIKHHLKLKNNNNNN